jgi:hypothetical protein
MSCGDRASTLGTADAAAVPKRTGKRACFYYCRRRGLLLLPAAKLKQMAEEHKAKLEAEAKALRDEQDKRVAEENAQIIEEFNSH